MKISLRTIGFIGLFTVISGCAPSPTGKTIDVQDASSSSGTFAATSSSSIGAVSTVSSTVSLPAKVSIDIPFSPQAPTANWDALHEEACEEMSLIMVRHFLEKSPLSRDQAETEVQDLIAWETDQGYGYDVTTDQLA